MATMTVPPSTQWKRAPPATLSRSLEGLEIGIPPGAPLNKGPAVSINHLWLWKPLPRLPEQRNSSVYSRESIIDNYIDRDDKVDSTYAHPDLIISEPDEAQQSPKSPTAPSRRSLAGCGGQGERYSLMFKAFLSEEQYGVGMHLAKANHYFREKKWEIFPELAPQPVTRAPYPPARSRKWRFPRKRHPTGPDGHAISESDGFGLKLKPIRSYVEKTLSKKSSQLKTKNSPSETSVPFNARHRRNLTVTTSEASFSSLIDSAEIQRSLAEVRGRMQALSLWSHSSDDSLTNPQPWRKPVTTNLHRRFRSKGRARRSSKLIGQKAPGVRFVRYHRSPSLKGRQQCPGRRPPSPSTPSQSSHLTFPRLEYAKVLHQSTNSVLSAIDGARKKIAESRAARRRAELKKHIRVIGPVEQYPDGTVNQWL
ncbi:hypothetical protein VTN77DRAFT_8385 [Rasamsonia byssochlamydoides]|uniref:uncharacterized protein n=1 Tax=Rasamsonia byssochlamydoides TaxID=89139 RepID=UPI003743746A